MIKSDVLPRCLPRHAILPSLLSYSEQQGFELGPGCCVKHMLHCQKLGEHHIVQKMNYAAVLSAPLVICLSSESCIFLSSELAQDSKLADLIWLCN